MFIDFSLMYLVDKNFKKLNISYNEIISLENCKIQ